MKINEKSFEREIKKYREYYGEVKNIRFSIYEVNLQILLVSKK